MTDPVLQDARRRYGDDDPQVAELRREIALLGSDESA